MQSLWLENQALSLRDIPHPIKPTEALIRVQLSGICGTDLELVRGYYPFTGIPGHEFVGEVIDSPDKSWIGKRVVGEINVVCGGCEQCKNGRPTHCEKRTVLGIANRDGVHAEYTSLPLANLHLVPDSVPDEAAVFTEPLAAALEIQEQVQIRPTDRVLLIGAGRLGQLVAQMLVLTGYDLCVVARHPHQKALLEARQIRLISEDEIQPRRWDVVVEATGSPSGFDLARQAICPRGTLVLKSTYQGEMTINWSPFVVDEITIVGSRCGPFEPALRLLERGEVDPTVLIAERYPLARALEAYEDAKKPGMLKVLLG
ncbi:MAG: alcohol dehydrogenase catalytic domain-containing protein [Chloroflexi bacterium]|nr:alcohol dehydrogenase catalytic domain-containing protein [Chloroflexota bacterium]